MLLMQRKEEAKRMLSLNDQEANVVEEFTVVQELMGLAIGSHGSNISTVRKIEGVEDVIIDEAQRSSGFCHFKVFLIYFNFIFFLSLDFGIDSRSC